jgi:hypothetical protein
MPRNSFSAPEWWNIGLYEYLADPDLPLAAWVWEFMRRDRLKMLRPGEPVDVMNPHRGGKETPSHLAYYYIPWHLWPLPGRSGRVFTVPSAIHWQGVSLPYWNTYFDLAHYELEDGSLATDGVPPAQWEQIRIDLNRSSPAILRDFEIALRKAREKYPRKRMTPKVDRWKKNQILQVWDLCEFPEFKSYWTRIAELPGMFEGKEEEHPYDLEVYVANSARNAYRSAKRLIEGKKWKLLAMQVADTQPQKKSADKPSTEFMEQVIEQEG